MKIILTPVTIVNSIPFHSKFIWDSHSQAGMSMWTFESCCIVQISDQSKSCHVGGFKYLTSPNHVMLADSNIWPAQTMSWWQIQIFGRSPVQLSLSASIETTATTSRRSKYLWLFPAAYINITVTMTQSINTYVLTALPSWADQARTLVTNAKNIISICICLFRNNLITHIAIFL